MKTLQEFIKENKKDSQYYTELDIENTDFLYQKAMKAKDYKELESSMLKMKNKFSDVHRIDFEEVQWEEVYIKLNENTKALIEGTNNTIKELNTDIDKAILRKDSKYLDILSTELGKILKKLEKEEK